MTTHSTNTQLNKPIYLDCGEGWNDTVCVEFRVVCDGKVHHMGGLEFNRFAKFGEDDEGSLLPVTLGVDTEVV